MAEFTGAFPAPTWTPPAPEPFVPLRPLTLGQLLAGAFRALRHNPGVVLVPAIAFSLAASLGGLAFGVFVVDPLAAAVGSGYGSASLYGWVSGFGAGALGWLVIQALVIGSGVPQQAVAAVDVSHAVVGRRLTPRGFRRRTRGIRARTFAWTGLVVLAVVLAGTAGIAAIGLLEPTGPYAGLFTGFLVYPACAALLAWLGTKLAFVPSTLAVERLRFGAALARSWRLTRTSFWRTFGIRLLAWGMIWIATMLVSVPVTLLVGWLASIVAGNGDLGDYLAVTRAGDIAAGVVSAVIAAIGLVVTTSVDALLYLDLRMRREGLDLELSRFMERRRATTRIDPDEVDPFRPPADLAARRVPGSGEGAGTGRGAGTATAMTDAGSPWA
ncbi:MAG: hypothetical protein EAS51_03380 [Microbacteriaceae bacterium]|nr:MAG: hypothetical protein EAS51_03380 [Microbacteriaceae bacterium]